MHKEVQRSIRCIWYKEVRNKGAVNCHARPLLLLLLNNYYNYYYYYYHYYYYYYYY